MRASFCPLCSCPFLEATTEQGLYFCPECEHWFKVQASKKASDFNRLPNIPPDKSPLFPDETEETLAEKAFGKGGAR